MTCIIGYADSKNMYIAGDSCGSNGSYFTIRKDDKIFKKGKMLFGYTTSFRMGQLLQWKLSIPKHQNDISTVEYMNTVFIDSIIDCFKKNGYAKIDNNVESGGNFIVCYQGRVFEIHSDYQIAEHSKGYSSCGCGYIAALASFEMAMSCNYKKSIEYKLKKALFIASSMIPGVKQPFNVLRMKIK